MIRSEKLDHLKSLLRQKGRIAIAFSGGTDSTFLLAVAAGVLGENVVAITVKSPYIPQWEVDEALETARHFKVNHRLLKVPVPESVKNNPTDRCYLCKKQVFTLILAEAEKIGFSQVADGTNADDTGDYRPGMRALAELGVNSPLLECGITKKEVRELSKAMGLATHDKPAYACLLTRIPYNTSYSEEELTRIEKAEEFLIRSGIRAIRVRHHGTIARIEADPSDFQRLFANDMREKVVTRFRELGYEHVTIDLDGYHMGSYNKNLKNT